jgi:DNA-binding CsgD family transcriptional regulator
MQPKTSRTRSSSSPDPVSTLATARDAWFRGDFDTCLAILDAAPTIASDDERREAILLHARALLRLRRAGEALELVGPVLSIFRGVDEACTARMLHGEAVARAQDVDRGLKLLRDLYNASDALSAHRAIRGEIAYKLAFVYWMKRQHRDTLQYALLAEAADADIISVRAAFLRGFVAAAQEQYPQALALFRSALDKYRACRERDQDLVELIVVQIAAFEVNLRSATEPGTHTLPGDIGTRIIAVEQPGVSRMQLASLDSWLYAFDGDSSRAFELARLAHHLAPTPAWSVWALANRANIMAVFGRLDAAREFGADGSALAATVDWNAFSGEERTALLLLAQTLAVTDPQSAVKALATYDQLTTDLDRSMMLKDEVRLWILETHVRGLVHRIRGEYSEAFEAFDGVRAAAQRVGILWRAALALIELDATPVGGRGDFYLETAARMVHEHFPRSFLANRLGRWNAVYRDPIAAKLAPLERKVLRHVLEGKSQKDVATAIGLTPDTVSYYVKALLRKFDVRSTLELAVKCYQRGLGAPSWWCAEEERRVVIAAMKPPRQRRSKRSA